MNIKNKINISFILVFVVVLFWIWLIAGIYITNLIRVNADNSLYAGTRARAEHIRTFLRDQKETAVILAAASVYLDFLKEPITSDEYPIIKEKVSKRFQRTLEAAPGIYETFIIDAHGLVLASSDVSQEGADKSGADYFLSAKNDAFISDVYFSETTNKLTYSISAPIKDNNGSLLGISVLHYTPDNLFPIIKNEIGLGESEENFLINEDKFFISPPAHLGESVILKRKAETKNTVDCFDPAEVEYITKNGYSGLISKFGSQIVETEDYRGIDVVATHAFIPELNWCLVTKIDRSELMSFRSELIIVSILILVVAALVFLLIGFIVSRRITNPLRRLQLEANKIREGDFDYRAGVNSRDEIGELANDFDAMASDLKKSKLELQRHNEDLKKQVEDKTKELEKARNELQMINDDLEKKFEVRSSELRSLEAKQEELIRQKTEDLNKKVLELEKINKFMINRETKMIDLKNKIRELESKL